MDIDPTLNPAIFQSQAFKPNAQALHQRGSQQRTDTKNEALSTRGSPVAAEGGASSYTQSTLNIRETIASPPPANATNGIGASTRTSKIDNTNTMGVVIERKHTPATQTFLQVADNGEEFRLIDVYV